ncbi:MAG: DnaB helicase C-terminal domain-containing protein, partial [Defluviitaleaceae bacterium]|nr:DnaB helicase C-terminal domain-containing protein [Defluviitaleaceae bacterium]
NCHTVEQQADKIIRLKPDLVIVDFLQYVRTAQKFSNGADRLEYIVSEYKRIARLPYCTCHIMVLSQYSRSEKGEGGSMFYLKGSSGIEQGGDYIFLLDRPHIKDDKEPPEKAIVKVAKNKFGKVGSAELYFEGSHQRFRELEEGEKWLTKEEKAERPWRKQKSTNGLMDLA